MKDHTIGSVTIVLFCFSTLWFFFGATWWVILTTSVIALILLGSYPEEDNGDESLNSSLGTGKNLFDSNAIDGKSARLILASALEHKDFVYKNTIEPIAQNSIRFLENRGKLDGDFEDIYIGDGAGVHRQSILAAARQRAVLAEVNEADMQRWLDVYRGLSECHLQQLSEIPNWQEDIDINKHFLVWVKNIFCSEAESQQYAQFSLDFVFSNAYSDFGRLDLSSGVGKLNNHLALRKKIKVLEKKVGNKTEYGSLAHAFNAGFQTNTDLGISDEEWALHVLPFYNDLHNNLEYIPHKRMSVSLHECSGEVIEDVIGDSFRRFLREHDHSKTRLV